jgi:hypothetical protein
MVGDGSELGETVDMAICQRFNDPSNCSQLLSSDGTKSVFIMGTLDQTRSQHDSASERLALLVILYIHYDSTSGLNTSFNRDGFSSFLGIGLNSIIVLGIPAGQKIKQRKKAE